MKLSTRARQQGLSYRLWKAGKLPVPAEKLATARDYPTRASERAAQCSPVRQLVGVDGAEIIDDICA